MGGKRFLSSGSWAWAWAWAWDGSLGGVLRLFVESGKPPQWVLAGTSPFRGAAEKQKVSESPFSGTL